MKKILSIFVCIALCLMATFASACAKDGTTPTIGANGNWWIDGKDTGIQAVGKDGTNGANGEDGIDGVDGKDGRGILKVEIIDFCLWVTYSDDPENPVNVGEIHVVHEGTQGLDFYPLPDGTYGVEMGKTKYLEEIVIPSTYNGKAVTQILPYAFADSAAKSIKIPSSVIKICQHAFDGAQITALTIPASVLYVEESIITSKNVELEDVVYEGDNSVIDENWSVYWKADWKKGYLSPIANGVVKHTHGFFHDEELNNYHEHSGVCILADAGTNVVASFSGTVTEINVEDVLQGPYIVVEYENKKAVYHFVNATEGLKVGDDVAIGQVIGTVCDAVGNEYYIGAHIQFELFQTDEDLEDVALNPEDYITFDTPQGEEE